MLDCCRVLLRKQLMLGKPRAFVPYLASVDQRHARIGERFDQPTAASQGRTARRARWP